MQAIEPLSLASMRVGRTHENYHEGNTDWLSFSGPGFCYRPCGVGSSVRISCFEAALMHQKEKVRRAYR